MSVADVFIAACNDGTLDVLPDGLDADIIQQGFNLACAQGHIHVVELFSSTRVALNQAFLYAVLYRHIAVMDYIFPHIHDSLLLYVAFGVALKNQDIYLALGLTNGGKLTANDILLHGTEYNDLDYMRLAIKMGAMAYRKPMQTACCKGYESALALLLAAYPHPNHLDVIMFDVGRSGHTAILNLMLEKVPASVFNLSQCLLGACVNGHEPIIEIILNRCKLTARIMNHGMRVAAEHNHISIVDLLVKHGAFDYKGALICACQHGHMSLLQHMHGQYAYKLQPVHYNMALLQACRAGQIDIVCELAFLVKHHKLDWDGALKFACEIGSVPIVQKAIAMGATCILPAAHIAVTRGHHELARLLIGGPEV
jgi:hypothetical protein